MKKVLVFLMVLIGITVLWADNTPTLVNNYAEFSNDATTLAAKVKVFVDQWYSATFKPTQSLTFTSAGNWDGGDHLGEGLGTFSIQSNGEVLMKVKIDPSETTSDIYSAISALRLIHNNDKDNPLTETNPKEIAFTLSQDDALSTNVYDIRADFNIDSKLKATGNDNYVIFYVVDFQPNNRLP
ncbi:hypothetical protein OSSY52_04460 [Tepiditoga spiralis]|uniref:Uncharacterized protein n=1 Tax=Tepiditoga spiralis TaxID=2108365 RepID=A0A7G1G2Z7_9BACT|nr:hypothetical protein [Tepiditoga spiralis]BBE30305.1 hypothetical protein OSSY52_04460 [Tepiditoga spiralis]